MLTTLELVARREGRARHAAAAMAVALSVACGLAAETLARQLNLDVDVAYTVGLLYGVGLVAIDEWAFRQKLPWRFAPGPLPLETCHNERAVLGFHNAEAGAALLR